MSSVKIPTCGAGQPAYDWSVDPFKLTEKDGDLLCLGSADDNSMARCLDRQPIRYKQEGYTPDRDIIVALET